MEPNDERPSFPAGYEDVAEQVALNAERIRTIEAEIERLRDAPEAGGPRPRLAPDGAPLSREPTNAEKTAYLNNQKGQIQKDTFATVEQRAAREADPLTRRTVLDAAQSKIYGNPYKGMGKEEMHATRAQQGPIDLEQSANYMDAQRGRPRSGPAPASAEQPKADAQPEKRDFSSPSYLASQSLNYTRMTEKADNALNKSAEPGKSVDKSNPDKPLLPSEMASLSLNYSVITKQTVNLGHTETKQEPTPGKDSPDEPDLNP